MTDYEKIFHEARKTIGEIDVEIATLFQKRMEAVKDVAEYKKVNGIPVEDAVREAALLEKNSALISDEEIRSYYINFQKKTMNLSKDFQHKILDGTRIAFSGVKGAFAEIAVKRIFPDGNPVAFPDFKSAYKAVETGFMIWQLNSTFSAHLIHTETQLKRLSATRRLLVNVLNIFLKEGCRLRKRSTPPLRRKSFQRVVTVHLVLYAVLKRVMNTG